MRAHAIGTACCGASWRWLEDDLAMVLERGERTRFVGTHHAGIADHIGG